MIRAALVAALALAAVLRGLPLLAPHLGVELEEAYPRHAVHAVVARDWRPFAPVHGAVLSDALRVLDTIGYGVGHALGRYPTRLDMLADFVRDPFPFVVAGRLLVLAASLVAVWLAARLGRRLGGDLAGPAAAVLLATSFIHVRETLHVWPDGVAATAAIATVLVALVHLERGTRRSAWMLGAVAGLALSAKHAVFPLALPVLLALGWGGGAPGPARIRHVAAASAAAVVAYLAVTPYSVLDWPLFALHMRVQALGTFATTSAAPRIPWRTLTVIALGTGPLVLAALGLATSSAHAGRAALVAAAFPVVYVALLARANPYVRYFAIAAPFVAAFGGAGAAALASRIAPRSPGLVTALLVALASAGPARASWDYVRLFDRPDTRILAGAWLAEHVAPGTTVMLPNIVGYANPVVAPDAFALRVEWPAWHEDLRARGLGDPARTFVITYQGILSTYDAGFAPRAPVVVTAEHPAPSGALRTPPVNVERLRAAGYRIAARFEALPDPPPPGLVYDPQEADYAPIAGAAAVPRLGPTLTIWRAP